MPMNERYVEAAHAVEEGVAAVLRIIRERDLWKRRCAEETMAWVDQVKRNNAMQIGAEPSDAPEHSYEAIRTDIVSALASDGFAYLEAEQLVRQFEMAVRATEGGDSYGRI